MTGPALRDVIRPHHRVHRRQRAVRVVVGQVAVPQLFQEPDRGLPADLLPPYLVGQFGGVRVRTGQHERRGRQDQQLLRGTAVAGQPALHVGVERLPVRQRAVPGEDRVGAGRRELAPCNTYRVNRDFTRPPAAHPDSLLPGW
jgi:hypothetical protein